LTRVYYKAIPETDVSVGHRRIAHEVIQQTRARFIFSCPQPKIIWYRTGSPIDCDFIEDQAIAGQIRMRWDAPDEAIELRVSAEHVTVEQLVRTVAHEMRHLYCCAHFRPPISPAERDAWERDAHRFEDLIWGLWVLRGADTEHLI
jgi:hypothetical protein